MAMIDLTRPQAKYEVLLPAVGPQWDAEGRSQPVCSVFRCQKPIIGRGLCAKHYQQQRRANLKGEGERTETPAIIAAPPPLTLKPYSAEYLEGRRRRGEIGEGFADNCASYLNGLAGSFGDRPLNELGPDVVDMWLETIGHLSPGARRAQLSAVRGFCSWLVVQKHIEIDPTRHVRPIRQPRSVPRAMPEDDIRRLLDQLPDLRAEVIVWLMVGMGMRCGEVSGAQRGDYDRRRETLSITGKGGHQRVLPVPSEAAAVLNRYIDAERITAGSLIRSKRGGGRGIAPNYLSTQVSGWMQAAGIKTGVRDGISAHALRHTCASDVLDQCGDLRVVQEMLGHQNLTTTSIYLRRAGIDKMREAMEGRDYRVGLR